MRPTTVFLLVPALSLTAVLASAAPAPRVEDTAPLKAVRVSKAPKIDGFLGDPTWQEAAPFTAFRMVEPRPGEAPTERTELRVLYDAENLYLGVFCADSEPDRIAANTMAHDSGGSQQGWGFGHGPEVPSDDRVRVLLDPFQDKRTAYIFFVNPRGARGEGLAYAGMSSLNWDGVWEARSRILTDGWSAEFRIPFKTISFKPGLSVWGLNVERYIPRKLETIRLAGWTRDANFANPNEAASLGGIEAVKQGLGITFRPYGLASATKGAPPDGGYDGTLDGGFDVYKSFTPNLVGVVSTNMDFAETEADERRINLTRFPLFFPEKRMFFLEGSETFSFSSSVSFTPFFSRKVGLYQGRQIPILFGAKLYGKVGSTNISALDVQSGKFEGLPGRNLFAARMTQNIFAQSKVGWIFTNGSPTGERNSLLGADFNYSSSRFLGDKNLMLAAWGAYNWNERKGGRHYGFGFRGDYPNDLWNVQTTYAYYGEALDPGIGFMMRQSFQTGFIRVGYQPRPTAGFLQGLVRQFYFDASADYYWDLAGNLETRRLKLSPFGLRTESGERVGFSIEPNRDILPYDFEVSRGIIIPAGSYDFTNLEFDFNTATHRPVSIDGRYSFGEFYSGHYDNVSLGLTVKLKGYASLALDTNLVRGRMPQGNFSENVYELKADIFLSPDLGLMNYIQYDDISRLLGWSARLRWRISPGNELYLVFNKNWERRFDPAGRFSPREERSVVKISLSIRP